MRTNLQALLDEHAIEHLIICGYATEFCLDTTTRKAASLGYNIELDTSHDKPHASAQFIREHYNTILPQLTSFDMGIKTVSTNRLVAVNV